MRTPNELFTVKNFTTLGGSSAIVFIVTSVIQYLTSGNCNPKFLAFGISELVACLGVYLSTDKKLVSFIIGFLNGMLIFATTLGINTVVTPQKGTALYSNALLIPSEIAQYESMSATPTETTQYKFREEGKSVKKVAESKAFFTRW